MMLRRLRFLILIFLLSVFYTEGYGQCSVEAGNSSSMCRWTSDTLNAIASGGTAPYSYFWTPGFSLSSPFVSNPTATPNSTTTYTVTITDDAGCTASDYVTITVNPRPTANAGNNITVCPGSGSPIGGSPTATGGTAPYTYNWSPAAGLSSASVSNPSASPAAATTYTVSVTDNNGCTNSDAVAVNLYAAPVAAFSFNPNNQCSGTPVLFTNSSTGSGLSYAWNFGDPSSGGSNTSTLQNPSHTFVTTGCGTTNYTVTLTVTNSNGCTSTTTQVVSVLQRPDPVLTDADLLSPFSNCDNNPSPSNPNFALTLNNATANSACINSYSIDWGDGNVQNGLTNANFPITHNYTALGAFNLTVTALGANGCQGTATYTVANQSNPAIGITSLGGTSGCAPQTFNFIVSGYLNNSPGTSYVIDFGDGTAPTTLTHAQLLTNDSIAHTYTISSCGLGLTGNQFTVTATAYNACASTPASVSAIKVYSKPVASFTHSPTVGCTNANFCFTSTTIPGYGFNCSTTTTYNWDFGDGTGSTAASPCHVYTVPGMYYVTLTTSNYCGSTTFSDSVCINAPPVSLFTLDSLSGCIPFNVAATNHSSTLNTCGTATYTWAVTYVSSVCAPTPGSWSYTGGSNANSINPSFVFNNPGTYNIRLTVTNGCSTVNSTQTVTVKTIPTVAMNAVPNLCGGGSVSPTATFNSCYGTISSYNWSFPGGSPATASTQTPGAVTYAAPGAYTISLSAANECGIRNGSTSFNVWPLPLANAGNPQTICAGSSVSLGGTPTASGGTAPYSYSWTSTPAGFTSTASNPTATPAVTTTYTVRVTDNHGCTANSTVTITVNPKPTVSVNSLAACNGTPATLNATVSGGTAPFNYLWSNTAITPSITVSPATTTTYSVTITDASGCTASGSGTLTIRPIPTLTTNNPSACTGVATNLTATGGGATAPYTYSWSTGAGTQTISVNPGTTTTYSVTVTEGSASHCTNSTTATLNVNPRPVVSVSSDTVCRGTTASLISTVSGATPPYTYSWSNTATTPNINVSPVATTNYTVTVTEASSTHCTSSAFGTVVVMPIPTVTIAGQSACIGNSATLNPVISGATAPYSLHWNTGDTTNSITQSPLATTTYTVTVSESSMSHCSNTASGTITINPLPVVNAGTDQTLCNQMIPYTLSGYSPAGGSWTGAGVTAGGVFTPGSVGVGSYSLVYTYTNANGCTKRDTVVMNVINATVCNAGTDTSICINSGNLVCSGIPAGGVWSGSPLVTAAGVFNPSTAGTYNLTYTYGIGTCATTDSKQIIVNALPVVNAGSNTVVCISAAPFNLSGATPAGGIWSGTGITNALAGTFSPAVSGAGTFVVTYTYTDPSTGCSKAANRNVTVNPLPVVNAGADQLLCNQMIPFILTGYSPAGGTWSGPGVTAGGIYTPGITGAGTFALVYTFTNANGCTNQDTAVMTVVNPATANAGHDTAVCILSPALTLHGTPAGGSWSGSALVTPGGVFVPSTAGSYSLIYSYGTGTCLTRDTCVLVVNALPVVSAGSNQSVCIDVPAFNLSGNSPAGGVWSGTGITNAANGTFNPATAGAGSYIITYTYTAPATGCANASNISITVNPLPVAGFTHDTLVCINTSVTFLNTSTGTANYNWNFGDAGSSTAVNPSHTYTTSGYYTVTLIAYSAAGCTDTTLSVIHVIDPPSAIFSLAPHQGCGPLPVNFTNNSTGLYSTYSWNFGNGSSSNLQNPPSVLYNMILYTDTTYHVILSVTNMCGTSTATDSVRITYPPHADFGTNVSSGCSTVGVQFSNLTTGLPQSFLWDFGDGTTGTTTATTFVHNYSAASNDTTYTITLIAYNVCGSDTMTHSILVQPNPINAFFNTNPLHGCAPLVVNFVNYSTGNGITNNNFWNFGDGNISSQSNPVHIYTNPGTYTVSLAVNNVCSYDTTYQTITVFPFPVVNFSINPSTVCIGQNLNIINNSMNVTNTVWNFGDGQTSTAFTPVHSYSNPGTYHVSLVCTSFDGCVDSMSTTVTVYSLPVVNAGSDQIFCVSNAPTQLSGFSPAGGSWSGPGVSATGLFTPANVGAGQFTLTYSYTAANGCTNSDNISVNVILQPVADAGSDTSVCITTTQIQLHGLPGGGVWSGLFTAPGGTFTVPAPGNYQAVYTYGPPNCRATDTMTINVNGLPIVDAGNNTEVCADATPFNLSGTPAGGYWNGPGITNSAQGLFNPTVTGTGDYTVYYTYTDPLTLCVNQDSMTVTVTPLPQPDIVASALTGCSPHTVYFLNSSLYATQYLWNFGDGDTSTAVSPTHTFNNAGTYTVNVSATGALGCTATTTLNVVVYPLPTADVGIDDIEGCEPFTFTFPNVSILGDTFSWDFGDGITSTLSNPTHTYYSAGNYTVILTAVSVNGCVNVQTNPGMVSVHPQPEAGFFPNPYVGNIAESTIQFIDQSHNGNLWTYYFGDGSSSNDQYAYHQYSDTGIFIVQQYVANQWGCFDSATATVIIQDYFTYYAPNAFTPNGDGINDEFLVKGTGIDPDHFTMYIFDRWGKQLFRTDDPEKGWDGRTKDGGKICPEGVYTYLIMLIDNNGIRRKFTGTATLIH